MYLIFNQLLERFPIILSVQGLQESDDFLNLYIVDLLSDLELMHDTDRVLHGGHRPVVHVRISQHYVTKCRGFELILNSAT